MWASKKLSRSNLATSKSENKDFYWNRKWSELSSEKWSGCLNSGPSCFLECGPSCRKLSELFSVRVVRSSHFFIWCRL